MPDDTVRLIRSPGGTPVLCPVCGRLAYLRDAGPGTGASRVSCVGCGWILREPLQAGALTTARRQDFDLRLRAARREQTRGEGQVLRAELRGLISGLIPGVTFTVADISDREAVFSSVYLDVNGVPRVRDAGRFAWTSALRMLPADERERRVRLATGIDGLSGNDLANLLRDRLPPLRDDRVLVICRPTGWQIPEALVRILDGPRSRVIRLSTAGSEPAGETLVTLAAGAPLRFPLRLLTTTVEQETGITASRGTELFPAGATPGAEAVLSLRRIPGVTSDISLVIVAGDRIDTDPVIAYKVPAPATARFRLRAALLENGQVQVIEPLGATIHEEPWPRTRDWPPGRSRVARPAPVDLVCAIDLADLSDRAKERIGLARDLITLLDTEYRGEQWLRVGLVTCTDHPIGRRHGRREDEPVTSVFPFRSARDALECLSGVSSSPVLYPDRAPVEDLLYESSRLLAGSLRDGRIPVLLTLASRRPHPPEQRPGEPHPCPRHYYWRILMDDLVQATARCAVVADDLPSENHPFSAAQREEQDCWLRLGPAARYSLAKAAARQVAEDLRLLAPPGQIPPFPLPDEA